MIEKQAKLRAPRRALREDVRRNHKATDTLELDPHNGSVEPGGALHLDKGCGQEEIVMCWNFIVRSNGDIVPARYHWAESPERFQRSKATSASGFHAQRDALATLQYPLLNKRVAFTPLGPGQPSIRREARDSASRGLWPRDAAGTRRRRRPSRAT